jgi:hypothetical protein
MTNYSIICTLILIHTFCSGCNSQSLLLSKATRYGTFKYTEQDKTSIDDFIRICDEQLTKISCDLKLEIDRNTIIEIYPNQTVYDSFIINPDLRGSPAISGNGIIQLVSPISKIKIDTISYPNRLLFIIHEYVHLMLDQLESPPPTYLDEGLACFYGSYDFYHSIIKEHFGEIKLIPSIEQLQKHYNEIPAADIFSFLVVDYLINSYKKGPISSIIRQPHSIISENANWIQYITDKYQ